MPNEPASADQHFIIAHDGKLHVVTSRASLDPSDPNATAEEKASAAWMASQLGGGSVAAIDPGAASKAPKANIAMLAKANIAMLAKK